MISGRSVRDAVPQLQAFLRRTGALYLDSGESRGMVPAEDPSYVPAMRGRVIREADLVITLGRRLDFQLGFTAMDIDTAVRRGAEVLFVVADNESWNIERRDQLDRFDGNLVGVDLPGCRYDEVARGLGAHAERIEDPDDLPGAIKRGLANAPALLDVMVTRDAVSADYTSGLAVVPPFQALRTWSDAEVARREDTRGQDGSTPMSGVIHSDVSGSRCDHPPYRIPSHGHGAGRGRADRSWSDL